MSPHKSYSAHLKTLLHKQSSDMLPHKSRSPRWSTACPASVTGCVVTGYVVTGYVVTGYVVTGYVVTGYVVTRYVVTCKLHSRLDCCDVLPGWPAVLSASYSKSTSVFLCYAVLYSAVLHRDALCCIVLCCTILCCASVTKLGLYATAVIRLASADSYGTCLLAWSST